MIRIGDYTLANRVALAPMAGVTDLPFRRLCTRFGAGYAVAEMVTADPSLRDSRKSRLRSRHDGEAEPRAVQIVGGDPAMLAEAARYNVALGAQVIDINMGCPAKKVCRKAAGSALLADEELVANILHAVVAAVDVPVTLKIRTGPTPERRNGVTIARIAEDKFAVLLPSCSEHHGHDIAERMCRDVEDFAIDDGRGGALYSTLSIGVVTWTPEALPADNLERLSVLLQAEVETALAQSVLAGGNRVSIARLGALMV
mgnify:CR=1 FL=1